MRIAVLQHAGFEGLGRIHAWLEWRGLSARVYPLYRGAALPALDDFELLILLGAPLQGDAATMPWLDAERALIRGALQGDKRLLGIGFGGELIAEALGARVRPLQQAEIGWWPLEQHPQAKRSPLGRMLPQRLVALHWHARGFDLPAGALPLYGSAATLCQGFVWRERAIALQPHLECTPQSIEALLGACADDLALGSGQQDAGAIRQGQGLCSTLRISLYRVLDYLSGPHATLR